MTIDGVDRHFAAGPADFLLRHAPLRLLESPAAGEIHAWFLDLQRLGGALAGALEGPGAESRQTTFTSGQLRFVRRFYLRLLLGAYLDLPGKSIRLIRSPRGKPVLDPAFHPSRLHFSMAKSGARLLLGVSTSSELGVDLEPAARKARNALGVARRYFSAPEAEALERMPSDTMQTAFLHTWACKEAVVKASGKGIANELRRFTVETDLQRPPAVLEMETDRASDWSLALLAPEPGYLGAIAVHNMDIRLHAFRLLPARDDSTE